VGVAVDVGEPASRIELFGHELGDPRPSRAGLSDQEDCGGRVLWGGAGQVLGDDVGGEDATVLFRRQLEAMASSWLTRRSP
jgi:hypothetical protein